MRHARWVAVLWISLGLALLLALRWFHFLSNGDIAQLRFPSTAQEAIAIAEIFCFITGLSVILIGFKQAFTLSTADPRGLIDRRHARGGRVGFFLPLGFGLSVAGVILWSLPLDRAAKQLAEGLSPIIGFTFALMTLLTATGIALVLWRQRLFDRRHSAAR